MERSRDITAVITDSEPPNGTRLVIAGSGAEWLVVWRDDEGADDWYDGDACGQCWFSDPDEDPMELHQYLKYADAVYALGAPLAVFV